MQVADCRRKSINSRRLDKCPRTIWRGKSFLDFFIVNSFSVNVRAATKIVRLRLHQRAGEFSVLHDLASFGDDFLIRSVVICLGDVNMHKLITRINGSFAALDRRPVIQVQVHLNAIFSLVVIHQITHILQPHGFHFSI